MSCILYPGRNDRTRGTVHCDYQTYYVFIAVPMLKICAIQHSHKAVLNAAGSSGTTSQVLHENHKHLRSWVEFSLCILMLTYNAKRPCPTRCFSQRQHQEMQ